MDLPSTFTPAPHPPARYGSSNFTPPPSHHYEKKNGFSFHLHHPDHPTIYGSFTFTLPPPSPSLPNPPTRYGDISPLPYLGVDDASVHPVLRPEKLTRHADVDRRLFLVSRDHPHHHPASDELLDRLTDARLQLVLYSGSSQKSQALSYTITFDQ